LNLTEPGQRLFVGNLSYNQGDPLLSQPDGLSSDTADDTPYVVTSIAHAPPAEGGHSVLGFSVENFPNGAGGASGYGAHALYDLTI
jgi:hypothetical protein